MKKHLIKFSKYLPQIFLLFSVLVSNVFFPVIAIAEELDIPTESSVETNIPIDDSEDILDDGISTSIFEEGVFTVNEVVEGEVYVYPNNEDVTVKFTKVTEEGNLVIKMVKLTDEEKSLLNTSDDYGWDITSSMSNGSFSYDLTLPNTHGDSIEVKYTEDGSTYESVDSNLEILSDVVTIEGLEHFTVFIVTSPLPVGYTEGDPDCPILAGSVCYDTIQEAIDAASNGEVIQVAAGTYEEQVVIEKSITLISEENATILTPDALSSTPVDGSGKNYQSTIFINNDSAEIEVTIDGFIINANNFSPTGRYSGILIENANAHIKNNEITNILVDGKETFGIIGYGNELLLEENNIPNFARGGIGIYSGSAIIKNNTVTGPGPNEIVTWAPNGIQIGYGASGTIQGNKVSGCGWPGPEWSGTGIMAVDTSDVNIVGNTVIENEQGIAVVDFPAVLYGPNWEGVVSDITVLDNIVTNNSWGLSISNDASNIYVEGNHFSNTEYDNIDVHTYGEGVTPPSNVVIYKNTIESAGFDQLWVGERVTETVNAKENWWGSDKFEEVSAGVVGNADYCPWLDSQNGNPVGPCLGDLYGRTFIDNNWNGLLLSPDGDYSAGMKDGFTVRLYDSTWDFLEEQVTNTTGKVGQFHFKNLDNTDNTYYVCGAYRDGYFYSPAAIGQEVVDVNNNPVSGYKYAEIVANNSGETDESPVCWEITLDSQVDGAYLSIGYTTEAPSTPEQTGYKDQNGEVYSCTNEYTNMPSISVLWTDEATGNTPPDNLLKYQRQYSKNGSNWSGHEVYPNPYTTFRSFGYGEVTHYSRVRSFYDLNMNNQYDSGEPVSGWSNSCSITYDKTPPTGTIDGIRYPKGDVAYFSTNDNTPTIFGTYNDLNGIKSISVDINGITPTSGSGDNTSWEVTFPTISDGTYTLTALIEDNAGNQTTLTQEITIDTKAPTAIYTQYINGVSITDPIAYVQSLSQLSFTAEYSDQNPSSELYQDSFVIFQAQDDGSFRFSQNGKQAYCSWRSDPNRVMLSGDTYSLTTKIQFTECVANLPDGEYYMAHQVYDSATRQDIPSIYQFKDVLGLHFIVDTEAPTSEISIIGNLAETQNITNTNGWHGDGWYYDFTEIKLYISSGSNLDSNESIQYEVLTGDVTCPSILSAPIEINDGENISTTINSLTDGVYTLCYQAKDSAGNLETPNQIALKLDRTNPEHEILTNTINGNEVNDIYYITSDTINFDIHGWDDSSGYFRTRYDLYEADDNWNCTRISTNGTDLPDALLDETQTLSLTGLSDGKYCLRVWIYDDVQNKSWSDVNNISMIHFVIDNEAPETPSNPYFQDKATGTILSCDSYTNLHNNLTEHWSANTETDLDHYEYSSFNAPNGSAGLVNKVFYTNFFDSSWWIIPMEGTYSFKVRAVDFAGNTSEYSEMCNINIDWTNPEISGLSDMVLTEGDPFPTDTVTLTELHPSQVCAKAEDITGGLGDSGYQCVDIDASNLIGDQFSIADEIKKAIEDWQNDTFDYIDLNVLPEGIYEISYYATDLAGNESTPVQTFTVTINDNIPTVEITTTETEITQGDADIVLGTNITNGNSPFTYLWSGNCSGTGSTTTFPGDSEPGNYTCTVTVTDVDGDTNSDSIDITVGAVQGAATQQTSTPTTTFNNTSGGVGSGSELLAETQSNEEFETQVLGEETSSCETKVVMRGYLFLDKNSNNLMEENEKGIAGVSIRTYYIDKDGNEITLDNFETDENGYWETQICPGEYKMEIDQETLPKNISSSETIDLQVADNLVEPMEFNIAAVDTRNFWQKYWYLILIASAVIVTIGYVAASSRKKEIIQ
jgi:hypothetical protein